MHLVEELKREFGSHLNADMQGWDFAASYGEIIGVLHASAFINSNRDTNKHPEPISLRTPWSSTPAVEEATPAEIQIARARLAEVSVFAN